MEKQYTILELNKKLIGEVKPTGSQELDTERIKNVAKQGNTVYWLARGLVDNLEYLDRHEASMKEIANSSATQLKEVRKMIDNALEDYNVED